VNGKEEVETQSGSCVAPLASYSAFTILLIADNTCVRVSGITIQTSILIIASLGIIFSVIPAITLPIVTTAASLGSTSLLTILWSRTTMCAA
jgi:hypothetical protein